MALPHTHRAGLVRALSIGVVLLALGIPEGAHAELPVPSVARLDAELRFRGALGLHLHDLQAGQDDRIEGVFQRVRLGARFRTDTLEARLQLQTSGAFGAKGPGEQPVAVGLQQGSVRARLPGVEGLHIEVGRMALEYGAGRHIARYDFHDEGNAYDGVRLSFARTPWLEVDALGVKLRRNSAQPDKERTLFGVYVAGHPLRTLDTDVYLLVLRDGSDADQASLQTMGLRWDWRPGPWLRAEAEGALQVGTRRPAGAKTPLDHLASAVSLELSTAWTLGVPMALGLRAEQYSGDDGTQSDTSAAWRPLYPDLVRHTGLLQLFAPTGLRQVGGWLRVGDAKALRLVLDARMMSVPGGAPLPAFSRPTVGAVGAGWVPAGLEVDATVRWPLAAGSELLLAGAVFAPSDTVAQKLGDQWAQQVLLQWTAIF